MNMKLLLAALVLLAVINLTQGAPLEKESTKVVSKRQEEEEATDDGSGDGGAGDDGSAAGGEDQTADNGATDQETGQDVQAGSSSSESDSSSNWSQQGTFNRPGTPQPVRPTGFTNQFTVNTQTGAGDGNWSNLPPRFQNVVDEAHNRAAVLQQNARNKLIQFGFL